MEFLWNFGGVNAPRGSIEQLFKKYIRAEKSALFCAVIKYGICGYEALVEALICVIL